MGYKTISEIRAANKAIGNHWFDRDTMRFFRTRIESGVLRGRFFITSEQSSDEAPRRYSVREALEDGSIRTVGKFQQYLSKEDAKEHV